MPVFPQFERLVWFHEQAQQNRYPNAPRLADQFMVSVRTARRDIDLLRDRFNAPLEYDPNRKGFFYTVEAYELPLLTASQQEVLCLLAARQLLSQSAGGYISRELTNLGQRLFDGALPGGFSSEWARQAFSADWSGFAPVQEETFRRTAWALLKHRPIRFEYRSPRTGAVTRRSAEPHHLLHYNASWVLIAWCRRRRAWRMFYLSRMTTPETLDQTFSPRPADAWRPMLQNAFGLFFGQKTTPVRLRFSPFRARWIREQQWHPEQQLKDLPDGGVEMTLQVADFREIKMKILQFGADCKVVAPRELRREIRQEIEKMANLYPGDDPPDPDHPSQVNAQPVMRKRQKG